MAKLYRLLHNQYIKKLGAKMYLTFLFFVFLSLVQQSQIISKIYFVISSEAERSLQCKIEST